ncbi:MAG: peptide deformylase [Xanthomonadales bacterium]|nr:peptide deformylase [Xanthomonadales bacterium]
MAVRRILEFPDPRLRTRAAPVERFDRELEALVADLFDTMYAARGIGLAATQIDVHRRVLVADVSEDGSGRLVLVNPVIVAREGEQRCEEGCLSVPELRAEVPRAARIRVRAQDAQGETFELEAEGLLAVCIQHEMDHLEGRLFVDYLSPLKREMARRRLAKRRRLEARDDARAAR